MSDTLTRTTARQQIALLAPNAPATTRTRKYAHEADLFDEGMAVWLLPTTPMTGWALAAPVERYEDALAVLECRGMTPRARGLGFVLVDAQLERVGDVAHPWNVL